MKTKQLLVLFGSFFVNFFFVSTHSTSSIQHVSLRQGDQGRPLLENKFILLSAELVEAWPRLLVSQDAGLPAKQVESDSESEPSEEASGEWSGLC